jgi:integrase
MKMALVCQELAALKRIFNLGARQTPPKVDRVPYIPMLKESNVRKGFFEHGDFLALRDKLPEYLKGFVSFAYKTGWRVSEIQGLTWAQVDLANGIVRLEAGETKNDDGRTVYLDKELQWVFKSQEEGRKDRKKVIPRVFVNEAGDGPLRTFGAHGQRPVKRRRSARGCSTISGERQSETWSGPGYLSASP